jgi:hypothetical protein
LWLFFVFGCFGWWFVGFGVCFGVFFVCGGLGGVVLVLVVFLFGFVDLGGGLVVLVNFKYGLGFIMVLRLILCLKLPRRPRRKPQRRNEAVLGVC